MLHVCIHLLLYVILFTIFRFLECGKGTIMGYELGRMRCICNLKALGFYLNLVFVIGFCVFKASLTNWDCLITMLDLSIWLVCTLVWRLKS